MWPEPRRVGLLFAIVLLLSAHSASAQLSYKLAPIGGRSELLGGTGMTFGRDATAAFLNPATAVLVDDQRLSFSVNFYKLSLTHSSDWYAPGPIDRTKFGNVDPKSASISELVFDTLPSSLCFYLTSEKLRFLNAEEIKKNPLLADAHIGLCFATVQDEEFNFGAERLNALRNGGSTRQVQTISQKFTKFETGPTYAVRLTNALSVGASLHGAVVNHKSLLEAGASSFGGPVSPITSSYYGASSGSAFSLEALLGATLRFGKQTLGLSVQLPSLHVYGVGSVNRNTTVGGAAGDEASQLTASGSFVANSPLRIGLGTGVEGNWGQFEVNAFYFHQLSNSYHVILNGSQTTTAGGNVTDGATSFDLAQRSKGVIDLAAGAEMYMSPRISMLLGASTDVSAAPKGTLQGTLFNYFEDRSNRISFSTGLGTHGTLGELNAGAQFSYSWGERLSVDSYQLPPVIGTARDQQYQLMIIIAGSTSLQALKRVVEDVKNVVTDPTNLKPAMIPKPQKPASNPEPQKPLDNPLDPEKN